eukprot:COSAG01_NODE_1158_length_11469_cov_101.645646_6_plen_357_part_00
MGYEVLRLLILNACAGDAEQVADLEHDGKLTRENIEWFLVRLSEEFGVMDVDDVLQNMDTDGDGLVDKDEFVSWWQRQSQAQATKSGGDAEDAAASALRRIQASAVYYRDLVDDQEIERLMQDTKSTLSTLLVKARKRKLLQYTGALTLFAAPEAAPRAMVGLDKLGGFGKQLGGMGSAGISQGLGKINKLRGNASPTTDLMPSDGPEIIVNRRSRAVAGESTMQMLCGALSNGAVLCELLNFFLPTRARVPVWKPSLLDNVVAETMGLAGELVDGAMQAAGEVAAQSAMLAEQAAAAAEANAIKLGGEKAAHAIAESKAKIEQAKQMSGMNAMVGEAGALAGCGSRCVLLCGHFD